MRHDVRDAEPSADLDQLAARDDHLSASGDGGQPQKRRCGVVVYNHRRFGSGETAKKALGMNVTFAAPAGSDVVLEIRVALRQRRDAFHCRLRQRRPPEIRVNDDARCVDDRTQ